MNDDDDDPVLKAKAIELAANLTSIAISLNRIADSLEDAAAVLADMNEKLRDQEPPSTGVPSLLMAALSVEEFRAHLEAQIADYSTKWRDEQQARYSCERVIREQEITIAELRLEIAKKELAMLDLEESR